MQPFERTEKLLTPQGLNLLKNANIIIIGVGGVGSAAAEALARAPIGNITLVDFDVIQTSNINRQLHATVETVNLPKAETMAKRLLSINPDLNINFLNHHLTPETIAEILTPTPDYVIDAIDERPAKIALMEYCQKRKINIVSSMGAGSRLMADKVKIADISKTENCPLAKQLRKALKKRGVYKGIKTVYSSELPILIENSFDQDPETRRIDENKIERRSQGTISYMPNIFGMFCASVVIQDLIKEIPFTRRGETPNSRNPK